jgi:hypothetical protein
VIDKLYPLSWCSRSYGVREAARVSKGPIHPSAWKTHSPKFVVAISEPPRSRLTATLYAPNRLKEWLLLL